MRSVALSLFRLRCAFVLLWALAGTSAFAFAFEDVAKRAQALAEQPYKPPTIRMPKEIRDLDYDQYRDIRFRPEKAIWRPEKLPFELMLFLQGRAVSEPVDINLVEPAGERPLKFDPSLFDFGKNKIDADKLRDLAFNGFRVHFPLNKSVVQGRGAGVPGRELLPRPRQGPELRPLGPRPGGRHGGGDRRGVPALRRVLDRAAAQQAPPRW
jgi:glucan biosynthesis protein